ncbi:hypothetical protein MP638_006543 [Amoeboaphelidium occidentale]|nr:hypothetical protein MP638_006543 [Amoeboaphelidium occidentale]
MKLAIVLQVLTSLAHLYGVSNAARVYVGTGSSNPPEAEVKMCPDYSNTGKLSSTVSLQVKKYAAATATGVVKEVGKSFIELVGGLTIGMLFTCGTSIVSGPMLAAKRLANIRSKYRFHVDTRIPAEDGNGVAPFDIQKDSEAFQGLDPKKASSRYGQTLNVVFDFTEELGRNMKMSSFMLAFEERWGAFEISWRVSSGNLSAHDFEDDELLKSYHDYSELVTPENPILTIFGRVIKKKDTSRNNSFKPPNLLSAAFSVEPVAGTIRETVGSKARAEWTVTNGIKSLTISDRLFSKSETLIMLCNRQLQCKENGILKLAEEEDLEALQFLNDIITKLMPFSEISSALEERVNFRSVLDLIMSLNLEKYMTPFLVEHIARNVSPETANEILTLLPSEPGDLAPFKEALMEKLA